MHCLPRSLLFRDKSSVPEPFNYQEDMSAFGTFYQDCEVEPFFQARISMVTVSNVHTTDYRSVAISKQYLMMKPQTQLKAFRY